MHVIGVGLMENAYLYKRGLFLTPRAVIARVHCQDPQQGLCSYLGLVPFLKRGRRLPHYIAWVNLLLREGSINSSCI